MASRGIGPPPRKGSGTSQPRSGPSSRTGLSAPTASRTGQPKTSITRIQSKEIRETTSGRKIQAQSKIMTSTVTKVGSKSGPSGAPAPGSARIRMATKAANVQKPGVQITKVVIKGAGLKPTGKAEKQTCKPTCPSTRRTKEPPIAPFTEEMERGRPVSSGRYYVPRTGAEGFDPEEIKLRTKLQKYTPTALSHWKVELTDPFAQSIPALRVAHPDIVSGVFKSVRGTYPDYPNPQLEQRLDPSMPEEHWSMSLREAMSLETGVYEQDSPETGQREQFTVEDTVIERQLAAERPGPSRSPAARSPSPQREIIARSPPRRPSPKITIQEAAPLAITIQPPTPSTQMSPIGGLPRLPAVSPVGRLQHPEFQHTVDVQMVSPPRMQSPVGEIDAQQAIYLQRMMQATPEGTTVATQLRGTQVETPGQAKQIDITKVDRMPPPSPLKSPIISPQGLPTSPMRQSSQRAPRPPASRFGYAPQMKPRGAPTMLQPPASRFGYGPPQMMTTGRAPSPASPQFQATISPIRPVTPMTLPVTPSKVSPAATPIRLEATAPVPPSPAEASLNIVRRLVDEERHDVVISQELPPSLSKKLNTLKKKPQSMRALEETLDQSVPIEDEMETLESDFVAELMYNQESGTPTKSPKKMHDESPLAAKKQPIKISPATPIEVSPAAPAPLSDIVVPIGEAAAEDIAVVNEEITEATAEKTEDIPPGNAFSESKEEPEYVPRGELAEQKAPWDINLESLEDIVGGKISATSVWNNLPSDESVRATAGRLEYILDVQKPQHHSCVQLRGSQLPAWFPGFYSVLPQVEGYVRLEKSPSRAFAAAWNLFAPYQTVEQSEVVIL